MWKKIVDAVMEWVSWAERELKDKTGVEKRQVVIEKLVALIDIPFVPDLIESPIERIVYGYLVDRACAWLNMLGNGNFEDLMLTAEQYGKVAEMIEVAPADILPVEILEGASIGCKLDALYTKYAEA
jgi:hypothetical protein